MNKEIKIISLMVCLLVLMGVSKVSAQTLVLHHADKTTTDVDLYLQPRVAFQGDKLLITSTILNLEFPKDNVLRFTYGGRSTGISNPKGKVSYSEDNGKSFLIETKGERILLPYSHIHYFEAREKKTFVRAGMTEYSLFKTLGMLEEELPAQFRRCHRSYIVNTSKLRRVNLSENYLDLGDGIEVPVSKTYKQEFRKLLET